ncbi:hypothetical protein, partial [Janibacter hoylei]|uniref:hypothetical protein n=1 Tax=Janibacter hoylei TaxID=364298 RepID=UPI002491A387
LTHAITLSAIRGDANSLRRDVEQIAKEHVLRIIGIVIDEVRGSGVKNNEAAIAGDVCQNDIVAVSVSSRC